MKRTKRFLWFPDPGRSVYDHAMPRPVLFRRLLLLIAVIAVVGAGTLFLGTERGRELMHNPHHFGTATHAWVVGHPYIAPVAFLLVYCSLGVFGLPVWWMQVLSGYGFGLIMGIIWSQIGSTIASVGAASLSRFVFSDWFHRRIESQIARLERLDQKLGHNGLLVVCLVRLAHFIPAGASNLAFGLTRISIRDIAIGTLLAGTPTAAIFVAIGAAKELLHDFRFIAAIALINILMLGGILIRYLRPDWFRSIGVE